MRHADIHIFLYMLDGQIVLPLDGKEHRMSGGDAANIPVGVAYATRVVSSTAR